MREKERKKKQQPGRNRGACEKKKWEQKNEGGGMESMKGGALINSHMCTGRSSVKAGPGAPPRVEGVMGWARGPPWLFVSLLILVISSILLLAALHAPESSSSFWASLGGLQCNEDIRKVLFHGWKTYFHID